MTGLAPGKPAKTRRENTDRLGSTVALANGSAEVTTAYSYEPFGASTETGAASDNPYQFTGRENDGNGLQYNRARYYNLGDGRFVSQDPMGLAGSGANLYWYAYSDALDFTDPSGECIPFCVPNPIGVAEEGIHKVGEWVSGAPSVISKIAHVLLDVAAVPPYAIYYGSYEAAKGVNSLGSHLGAPGRIIAHTVNGPLVGAQVAGLGADAGIDYIKGHTVSEESVGDEGGDVSINPLHQWIPVGPVVHNALGIHTDGHIDIEW
jgi:RHS repeat-associated protein